MNSIINSRRLRKRNVLFASVALLILSFLSSYYFRQNPSTGTEVKKLQNYILSQEKDFHSTIADTTLMRKLVQQKETLEEFRHTAKKKYSFFLSETLSEQGEILFWNNQRVLPTLNDLSLAEGEYFQRLSNGYYVIIKKRLQLPGLRNYVVAYALIPVYYHYEVESNYLPSNFAHDESAIKKISISASTTPYEIKSLSGQHLFYITQKVHRSVLVSDPITLSLRIIALLLLLGYIQLIADAFTTRYGAIRAVLFLAAVLILIRTFLFIFPSFFYLRQFLLTSSSLFT